MSRGIASSLVLGTAQWGMDYGIAGSKKMPAVEVDQVLREAARVGVDLLDTAPAYGESESVIGRFALKKQVGAVVTKVAVDAVTAEDVRSSCLKSLQRLGLDGLYGLLLHRISPLFEPKGKEIWKELEALKKEGKVARIGVSVYDPEELSLVMDAFPIDLVQIPLNVLDQRMARSGLLKKAKERHIEAHARSIFLQGLLLMDICDFPDFLSDLIPSVCLFKEMAMKAGISPLAAAICFVRQQVEVDRLVVGIDSLEHFNEIRRAFDVDVEFDFSDLFFSDSDLIDPRSWSGR